MRLNGSCMMIYLRCMVLVCQKFSSLSTKPKNLFIAKCYYKLEGLLPCWYETWSSEFKLNLWLILLIYIYGRMNVICATKFIRLIWNRKSIGHKEIKKIGSLREIKTLDFSNLQLVSASGKLIYGINLMKMAFGLTTNLIFCRSLLRI